MSDPQTVGKIGFTAAEYSKEYLGYLAFIFLPVLLYPIYKFNFSYIENLIEKSIAFLFLFITLIIFQSLVVTNTMSGKAGDIIVDAVSPFVGIAGLWIFVLIGLFVSFVILFDNINFALNLKPFNIKDKFNFDTNKTETKLKVQKELPKKLKKPDDRKVVIKEVGDTAEIVFQENLCDNQENEVKIEQEEIQEAFNGIKDSEIKSVINDNFNKDTKVEEKSISIENEVENEHISNSIIVDELEENKKLYMNQDCSKTFKRKLNKVSKDITKIFDIEPEIHEHTPTQIQKDS